MAALTLITSLSACDSFNAYAKDGRVFVSMAGYQAMLTMTPDEARALATSLLNAVVQDALSIKLDDAA